MPLTEEDIRRIVREEIEAYFQRQAKGGNVLEEPREGYNVVRDAGDDLYQRAMDAMDATLGEQENPKVGKPAWLNDHPEARDKIRTAFNLTDPNLHVTFERGIHWEIGMGYGE